MKYNQYAYVETDFDNQVRELIDINFLPTKIGHLATF